MMGPFSSRSFGGLAGVALVVTLFAGCGSDGDSGGSAGGADISKPIHVDLGAPLPQRLSAFNFFTWSPASGFAFNEEVVPYELNAALFSDHALKQRALYVPKGLSGQYLPEEAFELPVGAVLIKNFLFPADFRAPTANVRLIETRLLIHYADGWQGWPYIWDADQNDAVLSPAGEVRPISFVDPDGQPQTASYLVPQHNQCVICHSRVVSGSPQPAIALLGIKARYLNRVYDYGPGTGPRDQLTYLQERGMLQGLPPLDSFYTSYDLHPVQVGGVTTVPPADVPRAARDYLDINCAHCHKPTAAQGVTSQLFLNHDNTDSFRLGVCKRPGSAGAGNGGFTFDIEPGKPDESILYFRMKTEDVGAMMPLLGRSVTDTRGAELVHQWIATMPLAPCAAPAP